MKSLSIITSGLAALALGGCVYVNEGSHQERHADGEPMQQMEHMEHSGEAMRHGPPSVESNSSFAVTRVRLRNAITSRGLTLFDEIDHQANAAAMDLTMQPSTIFIFGNPKIGSALMNADPVIGLGLPMRALVYEAGDGVHVATVSMDMMAHHHDLDGLEDVTGRARDTLAAIAAEATGTTE